ncbi:DUF3857 domain-containing transglutaminase family protein [Teredinibacter turnerae]|uniref:DUF3857 domain-containing transglutaminase family protein n=1 Tax=Teredinibacter turnerae TaxID=2426 RepID=UPI00059F6505|nr:DUF3857 domain-containing protein [Teredinibacter turnerae]
MRLLFLILLLAAGSVQAAQTFTYGQFQYSFSDVPAWVKPAKTPKSRGKPQGQSTEYALIDTQVNAASQNFQRYKAFSYYLHTSQAVSENSELEITFNPEYQQLAIHQLQLIREGKTVNVLRPEIFRLLQKEEDLRNGIYHGAVTAVAIIPDTRPGDRLDYSYTISGRNPVYGNKIFGALNFGWGVDVGYSRLRVLVPRDVKLQTRVHDLELNYKKRRKGDTVEHTWEADSVAGRTDEGDYPPWFVRYPFIEYSEYTSWQEVVAWAEDLYGSVDANSAELDKLVKQLQKKAKTPREYALAALEFSQEQIRYLGLEFGENSHLPHSPAVVLENRYGDCKDKTNLLVQLLRKRGIDADPTLVSFDFGRGFTEFLPSPLAFDHVIVHAQIDGQQVWLDPTRTHQAGRIQDRGFLEFGKGLIINNERADPVAEIAPLEGQIDQIDVTETFSTARFDQPVKLRIESRYTGDQANYQRYFFNSNSVAEISDKFLNFYAKIYPNIRRNRAVTFDDNRAFNEFTIVEQYEIPEFFTAQDNLYSSTYYASAIEQYLVQPQTIRRESPAAIGQPKRVSHRIVVEFANDVELYIDSTPVVKQQPAVEYRSRSQLIGKRFEHRAQLWVKKSWVDSANMADYLALTKEIQQDIDFSLTLGYPANKKPSAAINALVDALQ